jgi:hypothetical protein
MKGRYRRCRGDDADDHELSPAEYRGITTEAALPERIGQQGWHHGAMVGEVVVGEETTGKRTKAEECLRVWTQVRDFERLGSAIRQPDVSRTADGRHEFDEIARMRGLEQLHRHASELPPRCELVRSDRDQPLPVGKRQWPQECGVHDTRQRQGRRHARGEHEPWNQ